MDTSTLLLLGGLGALVYYFGFGGSVVGNLKFVESSMNFDISNPLRAQINLTIIVQNPTSGSITLQSMAGYFYINGSQAGNVSYFTPTVITPNSQTQITLQLSVNDLSLVSIIMNYVNAGSSAVTVEVKATANANNIPIPIDLSFQPIS